MRRITGKRGWLWVFSLGLATMLGAPTANAAVLFADVGNANLTPGDELVPGDTFDLVLAVDTEGSEFSLFEGTTTILGGSITGDPTIRFGIQDVTAFFTLTPPNRIVTSQTLVNTGGPRVELYDLPVMVGDGSVGFQVDVVGFAQRDVPGGVEDLFRLTTSIIPIYVGSPADGRLLGTSVPVVPEPGTIFLLGLGLTSLAVYGRRRRAD